MPAGRCGVNTGAAIRGAKSQSVNTALNYGCDGCVLYVITSLHGVSCGPVSIQICQSMSFSTKASVWQLSHVIVHLPVLVSHRGRCRSRVVEEHVARRCRRSAFEVIALLDSVERRLDDARVLARLDLVPQTITLGPTSDVDESRQPVERGEELVMDCAGLDVTRPAVHVVQAEIEPILHVGAHAG